MASIMGLTKWNRGLILNNSDVCTVVAIKSHELTNYPILYGIRLNNTECIIDEKDLELYDKTKQNMKEEIKINRDILNHYWDAATEKQRKYINDHFKIDGTTTLEAVRGLYDIACDKWKPRIKANHPECFPEESKYFDLSGLKITDNNYYCFTKEKAQQCGFIDNCFMTVRSNCEYKDKGFYLSDIYHWELLTDSMGALVLIPTKKINKNESDFPQPLLGCSR